MKYNGTTQTIYEAAGGRDGLLKLASAWHGRVLEDEVVSHAFSHGFHRSAADVPDGLHICKWSWQGLVSGAATDDV